MYILYIIGLLHVFNFVSLRDGGDFSDRVVLISSREDDPAKWFDKENPQFEYIGQLLLGGSRYIKARIRQTNSEENISSLREDPNVERLRRQPDILWVEQEKFKTIMTRTMDPEWPYLWYLNDDFSPSMGVTKAWQMGRSGKNVTIAVVDNGLDTDHPDISPNIDKVHGISFRNGSTDPKPKSNKDNHGTKVAGLIAAVKDNGLCIPGVAYNSTVIGVQLPIRITDSDMASAFTHYISDVDIYSNSWGADDGFGFDGPGILAKKALHEGVTSGRYGKGAIYVFAAGNGGQDDNCNADGYANSIYTIAITSVRGGKSGFPLTSSEYSEVCSPALAATYGGSRNIGKTLTTTDINGRCTNESIEGTSYSAPIASGIIAMTLEENPFLTWRDIQYLIVLTSKRYTLVDNSKYPWSINGANHTFSQILGFGLMDAAEMVSMSSNWTLLPTQQNCSLPTRFINTTTSDSIYMSNTECFNVNFLEHVVVNVKFTYRWQRGDISLYLTSPSGTKSNLLTRRSKDIVLNQTSKYLTWTYMSVHFWGETPVGNWTLQISPTGTLKEWNLIFYGTATDPKMKSFISTVAIRIETSSYNYTDMATLNNQTSIEYKDIKAGLEEYWMSRLQPRGACINEILIASENDVIGFFLEVFHIDNGIGYLIKACNDLANGGEMLRFGNTSFKADQVNLIYENKYDFFGKGSVWEKRTNLTHSTKKSDLCTIRSRLYPCGYGKKCEMTINGRPICVSENSPPTEDDSSAIGWGVGGTAAGVISLTAVGSYAYYKKRRSSV